MDDSVFAVWALVLVVAAIGYAWLVRWRIRVYRRRKQDRAVATPAATHEDRLARALDTAARLSGQAPTMTPSQPPPLVVGDPIEPAPTPPAVSLTPQIPLPEPEAPPTLVTDVLAGIELPEGLVPLTTMAPRTGAGDRVAFWTDRTSVEVVRSAMERELERIGCGVTPTDATTYALTRGDKRAAMALHADGPTANIDGVVAFPTVPASVVVEIWIPS